MISNSKQNWVPGQAVKVGFLTLTVVAAVPTPGDYAPDAYVLASKSAFYRFVPHRGLEKISEVEARNEIESGRHMAERAARSAIAISSARGRHAIAVADLIRA
jgi:hypothetical protein